MTDPPTVTVPSAIKAAAIVVDNETWMSVCAVGLPLRALTRHRISADRYRALRNSQDGVCAICGGGNFYAAHPAPLYIDHDHVCCPDHRRTCGECVRGLLCSGCNGWLGELELWGWNPRLNEFEWWGPAALAYLARVGCDPSAPARRQLVEAAHRRKVAVWPEPCMCRICDPDRPRRRSRTRDGT